MLICPDCGHKNIEGADECERCNQSLSALSLPKAASTLEYHISKDRVRDLRPRQPLVVEGQATVAWVLRLMHDHRVGCAVIVDEQGVAVGIFSERDALMRLGNQVRRYASRPISEFMTPSPETLEERDKIAFALHRMDLGGYRHIPILTDGRVTGVVSVRDILQYLTARLLPV
jgi:CBS domain-containing protein